MNKQGQIGVTSENIFPIIKKFLYSEHDIFLRELVSNAVDATTKLNSLIARGEKVGATDNLKISIEINKDAKTISISDNGIGMTSDEVNKYINQIAFSGAEEFIEKVKESGANIIGHFGLGFYSAFMVAEKVEINTLSYQPDEKPVHWVCDGSPNYTMSEGSRTERGTTITLHVDEDSQEFLSKERVTTLLNKYCQFLPVPIIFGKKEEWKDGKMVETDDDNQINNTNPLWTRKPSELTDEDYKEFYKILYPMSDEPLFWIHLNVDYPFNLTGILYFPKVNNSIEIQKNRIKLFSNQVYVTDEIESIVPEYLTLLHGVIDSPDIPLNVSRSYLQGDANVKKISNHITKKVADRLEELVKNDKKEFQEKWNDLKVFIQYGMLTDEKFYDRSVKFALLEDVDGQQYTIDEYKTLTESTQKDKEDSLIWLYTNNKDEQYSYINSAKEHGYSILDMNGTLDLPFMNHMEQKLEKTRFTRVDSNTIDELIKKDDQEAIEADRYSVISELFKPSVPNAENKTFNVEVRNLGSSMKPIVIIQDEWMRRMKDMSHMQAGMGFYGNLPNSYNVVINAQHPLIVSLFEQEQKDLEPQLITLREEFNRTQEELKSLEESVKDIKEEDVSGEDKTLIDEKKKAVSNLRNELDQKVNSFGLSMPKTKQIVDLAMLSAGLLQGKDLEMFVDRSIDQL